MRYYYRNRNKTFRYQFRSSLFSFLTIKILHYIFMIRNEFCGQIIETIRTIKP